MVVRTRHIPEQTRRVVVTKLVMTSPHHVPCTVSQHCQHSAFIAVLLDASCQLASAELKISPPHQFAVYPNGSPLKSQSTAALYQCEFNSGSSMKDFEM